MSSTDPSLRVLLVEDDATSARLVQDVLSAAVSRLSLVHVTDLASAMRELATEEPDLVVLDLLLPDSEGLGTLHAVRDACKRSAIFVLTAIEDDALGIAAVKEGAQDFLVKSEAGRAGLARAMRQAVERKRAQDELLSARVDRDLARLVLLDVLGRARLQPTALLDVGGHVARQLESRGLPAMLDAYVRAGFARTLTCEVGNDRFTFRARGTLDAAPTEGPPACYLTLGFLSGVIARVTSSARAAGTETTCVGRGDPQCTFVVQPR